MNPFDDMDEASAIAAVRWTCLLAALLIALTSASPCVSTPPCGAGEAGPPETFRFAGRTISVNWTCVEGRRVLSNDGI